MDDHLHKLLEKQIRKYFTPDCLKEEKIQRFLDAVNNSYQAYDRDLALSNHAFNISEHEYRDINNRLREELTLKEKGLSNLKELIRSLGPHDDPGPGQNDDMIGALIALNKHIESRKRTEATLLHNQEELKRLSLVASLNENGVIFTRPDGTIFWANDGFARLTGYKPEEVCGKTPIQLCKGELTNKEVLKAMVAAFTEGKTFNIEIIHYRKNGSHFWGYVKGQPVLDEKGDIIQYFAVIEDITDKKKGEELLRKNEEKYRGIISNMNLGLLEVDLEGKIRFANQSFCEMSGYAYNRLIGRNAAALFMKPDDQMLIAGKDEMRLQGISDAYEIEITNLKGQQRWWLISGAPQYNDKGEIVGTIGIHLDITGQKNLQHDLIIAREQAEDSARSKEAFLANMSHEIRTPMNAILGMGRQLKKTALDPRQAAFLDTINTAAENLLVIINDILDISKIEAGKLVIEQIGFRISELLSRAAKVMRHKAEEKGLQLSFGLQAGLPGILIGDPYRLNQVILNLVSNAVKFTEKGQVTIRCAATTDANGTPRLNIEVKDTGIGMDPAFIEHLFQKFQQADVTVARKYGGTGLGMSISKQLIELMGGCIQVNSVRNEGTTVTLGLPLIPGMETDLPEKKEAIIDNDILRRKKILLVEDNEMNRLVAITVLNNYGAVVSEVADGLEAVKAVRKNNYDLILMDVQMPVMDGYEATRQIRTGGHKNLPIVALTANAIKGEYEKCMTAGMNAYVTKPFEEDELIKTLATVLGCRTTSVALVTEPMPDAPLYNIKKLQQLCPGNQAFIEKMLTLFLQEAPLALADIRKAWCANDLATMYAVAHRIKPALDNLSIDTLKTEIRELEQLAKEGTKNERMEQLIQKLEQVVKSVISDIRMREKVST